VCVFVCVCVLCSLARETFQLERENHDLKDQVAELSAEVHAWRARTKPVSMSRDSEIESLRRHTFKIRCVCGYRAHHTLCIEARVANE